jgi:hypothetical protein
MSRRTAAALGAVGMMGATLAGGLAFARGASR